MKKLKSYIIAGIIFVSIAGTLLHFAYEFSGRNSLLGLFVPINESIWEHTKLIFFPMLIYSFYLNKNLLPDYPCINSSMILGEISGVISIIALYYTYSGIIGFNLAVIDISIFYISVISAFYIAYKSTLFCTLNNHKTILYFSLTVLFFMFICFSINPPKIPLFISP